MEAIDTRSIARKAMDAILKSSDMRDVAWEDITNFLTVFGIILEGDEEVAFRKKYNPQNKDYIPVDKALLAWTEFISKDDFILMLQSEAKILNRENGSPVHHAEDFRWMLQQVGEEIPDDLINDFIREATGKSDDLFDLNVYLQNICQNTKVIEEPKKGVKGKR